MAVVVVAVVVVDVDIVDVENDGDTADGELDCETVTGFGLEPGLAMKGIPARVVFDSVCPPWALPSPCAYWFVI